MMFPIWLTALAMGALPPCPAVDPAMNVKAAEAAFVAVDPAGLVVYRDPATGLPTSIAPEGAGPALFLPEDVAEGPVRTYQVASGAWLAEIPASLHSYSVVMSSEDGHAIVSCVEGDARQQRSAAPAPRLDANGLEIE